MLSFILTALVYLFTSIIYSAVFIFIGDKGYIVMQSNGWEPLDDNVNVVVGMVAGFIPILRPVLFAIYLVMLTIPKDKMYV